MYRSSLLRIVKSFVKLAPASTAANISGSAVKPGGFTPSPELASASTTASTPMGTGVRKKVIKKIIKKVKVVGKKQPTASDTSEAPEAVNRTNRPPASTRAASPPPPAQDAQGAVNPESVEARRDAQKSPLAAPRQLATPLKDEEPQDANLEWRSSDGEEMRRELRGISPSHSETQNDTEQPGTPKKTPMVKGYRIEEVLTLCGPYDALFARRLPAGGCQYFAWPGTPLSVASAAIVSMPDTIRTVHAVFGRAETPIDLVMDIDCPVPQEYWSMHKVGQFHRKALSDVLSVVTEELEKIGETVESQVVLQSPNLKKASFHVHTKLKDAAFEDYNALHGFLARFRARIPTVDLQIYRKSGMLRMFSCMKENHTSAMVVFDDPRWNVGFPGGRVPAAAAALHSVVVREAGSFARRLHFDPPRAFEEAAVRPRAGEGGGEEDAGGPRPLQVLLPRTEREAVETASRWLRLATEREVGEWRAWIGLGLCAFRIGYHFRDAATLPRPAMDEMLDAWREASRHCSVKFRNGECEQRWASFDIHKLGGDEGWWRAYQRLGRLEVPAQEALKRQAQEKERASTWKATIGTGRYGKDNKSSGGTKKATFQS